jgi:hypothetical protein
MLTSRTYANGVLAVLFLCAKVLRSFATLAAQGEPTPPTAAHARRVLYRAVRVRHTLYLRSRGQ